MTDQEVWDDLPAAIASTICANVGTALRLTGKRFLSIAEMGELCSGFISQARQGSAEPLTASQKVELMRIHWTWCLNTIEGL